MVPILTPESEEFHTPESDHDSRTRSQASFTHETGNYQMIKGFYTLLVSYHFVTNFN